jgi:hypothetical protein
MILVQELNCHTIYIYIWWRIHSMQELLSHRNLETRTQHRITDWINALLGNDSLNTLKRVRIEAVSSVNECLLFVARQQPAQQLSRFLGILCGLPYATTTPRFLCVVRAKAI